MLKPDKRPATTLLTLVATATLSLGITTARAQSAVDPVAVEILAEMTTFFGGVQQFSVHTQSVFEDQLESGQRVDFDVAANVTISRPNKLYSERVGELIDQVFYYDGETLSIYNRDAGVYAEEAAPGTLDALFDFAREELGFDIPVSDLLYVSAFDILMNGVTAAVVVGQAEINGVVCDHVAFHRPDVDFQVWVAAGDTPLPCKYVVTDTSTPELISVTAVMSDWDLAPTVNRDTFRFVAPEDAVRATFMPIDATGEYGR